MGQYNGSVGKWLEEGTLGLDLALKRKSARIEILALPIDFKMISRDYFALSLGFP